MTTGSHHTQRAKILKELASARGDWVPLPRVTQHAAQYNARIFELRRMGFVIRNRTKDVDGVRHSWFRLEKSPSTLTSDTESAVGSSPLQGSLELSAGGL